MSSTTPRFKHHGSVVVRDAAGHDYKSRAAHDGQTSSWNAHIYVDGELEDKLEDDAVNHDATRAYDAARSAKLVEMNRINREFWSRKGGGRF